MKVIQTFSARPDWYDRNPSSALWEVELVGIAPHSETVRGTYTVPSGKLAVVDIVYLEIMRTDVPDAVGRAALRLLYSDDGATWRTIAKADLKTAEMFGIDKVHLTGLGIFMPGDSFRITTFDGSTGGECYYNAVVKIFTFDA